MYNYDPGEANLIRDLDGFTYDDGDAAILDQIKMTDRAFSPGRINMNHYIEDTGTSAGNASNFLYQAAFVGIPWKITSLKGYVDWLKENDRGTGEDDEVSPTGPILSVVDEATATRIRHRLAKNRDGTENGDSDLLTFLSRGAMIGFPYNDATNARMSNAFGAITPENDLQAEAIPALSAGLFTAISPEPDTISFVVVAQAIRDLGGGIKIAKQRVDEQDETVEHTVEYGKFDYEKVNERYYYFDEILGEVKMLITIRCDRENRKVTLIQAEYID